MKTVKHRFPLFIIGLLSSFLFQSCIFKGPAKPVPTEVKIIAPSCSGVNIYAKLKKTDSGYSFAQFSTRYLPGQPWVRLNDRTPMWSLSTEYRCKCKSVQPVTPATEIKGLKVRPVDTRETSDNSNRYYLDKCKTASEELFRYPKERISFNVGSLQVPSTLVNIEFDRRKYAMAFNEAYEKLNIDFCQRSSHLSRKVYKVLTRYDNIESNYNKQYRQAKNRIELKHLDESGVYHNQCDLKKRIKVNISKNKLPFQRPTTPELTTSNLNSLIKALEEYYDTHYKEHPFFDTLTQACSFLNIQCEYNECEDVDCFLNYPEKVYISEKDFTIPIEVVIKTVDFKDIKPSKITLKDRNVELVLSGNEISLSNMSKKYLVLDGIAFYYNNIISSENFSIDMPPHSTDIVISLWQLDIEHAYLNFQRMTRKKAQAMNIEYGFALKYRIANLNKVTTLYETKSYNLLPLLNKEK